MFVGIDGKIKVIGQQQDVGADWIQLAEDKVKWSPFVNTVTNL